MDAFEQKIKSLFKRLEHLEESIEESEYEKSLEVIFNIKNRLNEIWDSYKKDTIIIDIDLKLLDLASSILTNAERMVGIK